MYPELSRRSPIASSPALFTLALATVLAGTATVAGAQPQVIPAPLPVRPGVPGTPREELGAELAPRTTTLLREGAFVASARATLAKGQSGRWFVVFDRDARGRQMPPMVVLPSQFLEGMERIAARVERTADPNSDAKGQTRMLVTGQTLVYQGHNYLLPTAPPILETMSVAAPPPPPSPDPIEDTPDAPVPTEPAEPSIEQIIGDLDRSLGARRASNPALATDLEPVVSETGSTHTRPAGFLTARRGRILRSARGEPVFVVDSGPGGSGAQEPPMTLLPCTNLTSIEALAERLGESATFTISGQVTVYRAQNFLLPTTFTLNRVTDQVIPNQ